MIKKFCCSAAIAAALILSSLAVPAVAQIEAVGSALRSVAGDPPDIQPLRDWLRQRGDVSEWGCEGLLCECDGSPDSPSCKIVAPYCVDDIECFGDHCSCIYGGGP